MLNDLDQRASDWMEIYETVQNYFQTQYDLEHGDGFCDQHRAWFDSIVLAATRDIYRGI